MTAANGLRPIPAIGPATDTDTDTAKRDMTLGYGGRTVAVRVYRDGSGPDGPAWRAVMIEDRTPLRHGQGPTSTPEDCFADAVRFLVADAEARASVPTRPA